MDAAELLVFVEVELAMCLSKHGVLSISREQDFSPQAFLTSVLGGSE